MNLRPQIDQFGGSGDIHVSCQHWQWHKWWMQWIWPVGTERKGPITGSDTKFDLLVFSLSVSLSLTLQHWRVCNKGNGDGNEV